MENLQEGSEAWFWMGGILATGLVEITDDPKKLSDGGFWVVSTTFEGQNTFAKFDRVERNRDFPITQQWQGLESTWKSSIDRDGYMEFVEQIRSQIEIGEVYQVNACRILSAEFSGASLAPLFAQHRELRKV